MWKREPKIIVFACNWCSYTAADLAGTTRLELSSNFTVIRVMCSGRVDPLHILYAFVAGADGVLVSGCHLGDCHYTSGNVYALRRVNFLRQLLDFWGMAERLEMKHISASEAVSFQQAIHGFEQKIRELGPNLAENKDKNPLEELKGNGDFNYLDKRQKFLKLLRDLSGNKGFIKKHSTKVVIEDDVLDSFGNPEFDPEKCIGCGTCQLHCSQQAIILCDNEGIRKLSHTHTLCIGCKTCQDVCPVGAVQVRQQFRLEEFISEFRQEDVALVLEKCSCGADMGTRLHMEYIEKKLGNANLAEPEFLGLCQKCRRKQHSAQLVQWLK